MFIINHYSNAKVWMFVAFQNSYVEILIPKGDGLGGRGCFGRCSNHEGRALMNGVKALEKRSQSAHYPLPPYEATRRSLQPRRGPWLDNADTPMLGFLPSEQWEISAAYKLPSLWYCVTAAQMD